MFLYAIICYYMLLFKYKMCNVQYMYFYNHCIILYIL